MSANPCREITGAFIDMVCRKVFTWNANMT